MKTVGLIGFGYFGAKLFKCFDSISEIKFCCNRSVNEELISLSKIKHFQICSDYKEIVDNVELVIISTPTSSHYHLAKEILSNQNPSSPNNLLKEIFIEKPLCSTFEEAKELIALAKEKNVLLYVDDVFNYRGEFNKLKEILSNKKVKEITFSWKKKGTFKDSILNNLVYHDLYLLFNLCGNKEKDNLIMNNLVINKVDCLSEKERIDLLQFVFDYGEIRVEGNYDRNFEGYEKKIRVLFYDSGRVRELIWMNEGISLDGLSLDFPKNDALNSMVNQVLEGKVDYVTNNEHALKAIDLLHKIERKFTKLKRGE